MLVNDIVRYANVWVNPTAYEYRYVHVCMMRSMTIVDVFEPTFPPIRSNRRRHLFKGTILVLLPFRTIRLANGQGFVIFASLTPFFLLLPLKRHRTNWISPLSRSLTRSQHTQVLPPHHSLSLFLYLSLFLPLWLVLSDKSWYHPSGSNDRLPCGCDVRQAPRRPRGPSSRRRRRRKRPLSATDPPRRSRRGPRRRFYDSMILVRLRRRSVPFLLRRNN